MPRAACGPAAGAAAQAAPRGPLGVVLAEDGACPASASKPCRGCCSRTRVLPILPAYPIPWGDQSALSARRGFLTPRVPCRGTPWSAAEQQVEWKRENPLRCAHTSQEAAAAPLRHLAPLTSSSQEQPQCLKTPHPRAGERGEQSGALHEGDPPRQRDPPAARVLGEAPVLGQQSSGRAQLPPASPDGSRRTVTAACGRYEAFVPTKGSGRLGAGGRRGRVSARDGGGGGPHATSAGPLRGQGIKTGGGVSPGAPRGAGSLDSGGGAPDTEGHRAGGARQHSEGAEHGQVLPTAGMGMPTPGEGTQLAPAVASGAQTPSGTRGGGFRTGLPGAALRARPQPGALPWPCRTGITPQQRPALGHGVRDRHPAARSWAQLWGSAGCPSLCPGPLVLLAPTLSFPVPPRRQRARPGPGLPADPRGWGACPAARSHSASRRRVPTPRSPRRQVSSRLSPALVSSVPLPQLEPGGAREL